MNVHPSRYLPTDRRYWRRSGVFIVNFQHILHLCSCVSILNFERVIAGWYKRFRNIWHDLWTNCAASCNFFFFFFFFFRGGGRGDSFPTSVARSKFVVQLESRESGRGKGGGGAVSPPQWGSSVEANFQDRRFISVSPWIAQNKMSTLWDQYMNGHLSVFRWISFYTFENWGSEFGIQNQYTGFKIGLNTALYVRSI